MYRFALVVGLLLAGSATAHADDLSSDQRAAISDHVRGCWRSETRSTMSVLLTVTTDRRGVARKAGIASNDASRMDDPTFRRFAQQAVRAVLDPKCSDLPLPADDLGHASVLTFRFAPGHQRQTVPVSGAHEWFAVNLDGNACQTMQRFGEETMQLGGMPTFSPADLVFWLRRNGASPHIEVTKLTDGASMTEVSWQSDSGQSLERIFFSDMNECRQFVTHLVKNGISTEPGALR